MLAARGGTKNKNARTGSRRAADENLDHEKPVHIILRRQSSSSRAVNQVRQASSRPLACWVVPLRMPSGDRTVSDRSLKTRTTRAGASSRRSRRHMRISGRKGPRSVWLSPLIARLLHIDNDLEGWRVLLSAGIEQVVGREKVDTSHRGFVSNAPLQTPSRHEF